MKKIYLFLLSGALFFNLQSQSFDWAKREGLWAYDYGYGITTDNMGNTYVAGKYELNSDFSGIILPDQGNHDIFLAKYSSSGTIQWVRTAGGITGDYATSVACDGSNYIYIAGEIEGQNETIVFPGSSIALVCEGSNDIVLAKYDLSGDLIWARRAGGIDYEKALGVTYDASGNVYICGLFRGSATFGGTTTIASSSAANDIFIAKYDMDGVFQWVQKAGSAGRDEAKSIQCDASGNVYICGLYSQGCTFGSTTLSTYNNTAFFDIFLAKYSSAGVLQWVKTAGGDYDDVAWSLTMDNAGKIYIAGEFNAYAPFDAIPLTTSGSTNVFVACYNTSGNVQWATKAGGILATGNMVTRARGIGCDGTNLYITGQFGATAVFGAFSLTAADSSDIFVASLDNNGTFLGAVSVGGSADVYEELGYESGNAICADAGGNVFATGALLNGGTFGSTVLSAYDRTDMFVTKVSQLTGVKNIATGNAGNIRIYPNPGNGNFIVDVHLLANQETETTIFNHLGQVVNKRADRSASEINLDLSAENKGMYFVEIKADNRIFREKIIIQ